MLAARAPHPARHVVSGLRSYYFRLAAATLLPVLYVRAQFISNPDGNNLHTSSKKYCVVVVGLHMLIRVLNLTIPKKLLF